MRPVTHALSAVAVLVALAACSQAPESGEAAAVSAAASPSAPQFLATSRQIMLGLVIPASNVVWGVVGEAPADDAAWEKVQASAAMIVEAGGLMLTGTRAVDQADWVVYTKAMTNAAAAAATAAAEKSIDKMIDTGATLYETCDTCHAKYMPARQTQ